jgi:NAD+ synthase
MTGLDVKFNPEHLQVIKQFITLKVKESGSAGVVFGLSGGIDSAVVLKLSTSVFRHDQISALFMPESTTPEQDTKDVYIIAKHCKIKLMELPIDPILKSYLEGNDLPDYNPTVLGNLKARIRMNIIFLIANSLTRLVLGTSNKSELLLGYFTKFGDGASDVAPIGDLYKTQVLQLAEFLKLPNRIISKPPTAGLVANQTDEDELGMDYATIDKILFGLERNFSVNKISKILKLKETHVNEIKNRMENNRHKRKFLKIPKIGIKTIGLDLYE